MSHPSPVPPKAIILDFALTHPLVRRHDGSFNRHFEPLSQGVIGGGNQLAGVQRRQGWKPTAESSPPKICVPLMKRAPQLFGLLRYLSVKSAPFGGVFGGVAHAPLLRPCVLRL